MSRFNRHDPEETLPYFAFGEQLSQRLDEHGFFRVSEFACLDGTKVVLIHPALINLLIELRQKFGPIYINSGFRSGAHNEGEGGKPGSRHLYGMAADITARRASPKEVADYCETLGVGGIGRYSSFTHVDVWGKNRRWGSNG